MNTQLCNDWLIRYILTWIVRLLYRFLWAPWLANHIISYHIIPCHVSYIISYIIYHIIPYHALINRARGLYEEIFVLTFKAYGLKAVRSMRLECQNKYFPYGPKSRLIRDLLYIYPKMKLY